MTRIMFALSLLMFLCSAAGSGLAQEGGWLGANVTSGPGLRYDLTTGKKSVTPAEAKVAEVTAGGPAAAAGLKAGDVILSVDERRIEDGKQLVEILRQVQPGSVVRMRVKRDGADLDLSVVLGKRPLRN